MGVCQPKEEVLMYRQKKLRINPVIFKTNPAPEIFTLFVLLTAGICSNALAALPAGWDIQTVDSAGDVGLFTCLALDSTDRPKISYWVGTNGNLKYASWDGSSWDIQTVDSAGIVGLDTSLALDSGDRPRISYWDSGNDGLKYASWDGSSWDIQTVDSAGNGMFNSLALDSVDRPKISYWDYSNDDLKYASWNGSSWDIQTIDSAGSVGLSTCLALDSAGRPRISYYDWTNGDLKLAVTCVRTLRGDLNGDCYVNFIDLAEFCDQWLECSTPFDPACE